MGSKLEATELVIATYRRAFADIGQYALLTIPMFVFLLIGNYLQFSYIFELLKHRSFPNFELDPRLLFVQLFGAFFFVMLFTNVVHRTLLGAEGPRNLVGFGWGRREFRVLGRGLLLVATIALLNASAFAFILVATAGGRPPVWVFLVFPFLPLASMVAIVFLYCRMNPYLIAACLDADLDLRATFRSTRGNTFMIFGSHVLTVLPLMVASLVGSLAVGSLNALSLESVNLWLLVPVATAFQVVAAIVVTVLLALIYEQLLLVPALQGNQPEPDARLPESSGS